MLIWGGTGISLTFVIEIAFYLVVVLLYYSLFSIIKIDYANTYFIAALYMFNSYHSINRFGRK